MILLEGLQFGVVLTQQVVLDLDQILVGLYPLCGLLVLQQLEVLEVAVLHAEVATLDLQLFRREVVNKVFGGLDQHRPATLLVHVVVVEQFGPVCAHRPPAHEVLSTLLRLFRREVGYVLDQAGRNVDALGELFPVGLEQINHLLP